LRLALHNAFPVSAIYVAAEAAHTHADLLQRAHDTGITLQEVSAAVFRKIGYGDNPDGILGVALQPETSLAALPVTTLPLYVVTEGLEKPGNLGAILRSADAAGSTGLIVCDSHTDVWNPNVVRASQGAFCTVRIAVASAPEVLAWLRQRHIEVFVATPAARQCYTEIDLRRPSALVVGAEHTGVSAIWHSAIPIRIPMAGQIDSLNVAQAASILLFEAVRQRRQ
jgi:TrmH family RNA methyltransferase